ncbi:MAG TPA: hypothetical protein PLG16_11215 [Planctomycetota bacterium]|nr:hypothetical protein [Planctomycetota bacterium]
MIAEYTLGRQYCFGEANVDRGIYSGELICSGEENVDRGIYSGS